MSVPAMIRQMRRAVFLFAWGENEEGRRFFEAMGFRLLRQQPLVLPEGWGFKKTSTVVYGWTKED